MSDTTSRGAAAVTAAIAAAKTGGGDRKRLRGRRGAPIPVSVSDSTGVDNTPAPSRGGRRRRKANANTNTNTNNDVAAEVKGKEKEKEKEIIEEEKMVDVKQPKIQEDTDVVMADAAKEDVSEEPDAVAVADTGMKKQAEIEEEKMNEKNENENEDEEKLAAAKPTKVNNGDADAAHTQSRVQDVVQDAPASVSVKEAGKTPVSRTSESNSEQIRDGEGEAEDKNQPQFPPRSLRQITSRSRPPVVPQPAAQVPKNTGSKLARLINYREGPILKDALIPVNTILKVFISSKHLHIANKCVLKRQFWGDVVYTGDSDLVSILVHCGHITMSPFPPEYAGLSVNVRVLEGRSSYPSRVRNGIRSRWWGQYEGKSITVEKVMVMEVQESKTSLQEMRILPPMERGTELMSPQDWRKVQGGRGSVHLTSAQIASLTSETLNPPLYDTTLCFGLANDLVVKYNLAVVADNGLSPSEWTSTRLKSEVLYLESKDRRFRLCWSPDHSLDRGEPRFFWSEVVNARTTPVNTPNPRLRTLAQDLSWDEIRFGAKSVNVRGIHYDICTAFWAKRLDTAFGSCSGTE